MRSRDLLLVIDMQNVYTKGQKWECLDTEGCADNINRVIDAGVCENVIFTEYLPAAEPKGVWKKYNEKYADVNADPYANAMMPQFAEALKKYPLYAKSVYSSATIPEVLQACRQVDRVVVTGVVAECCVLSTVLALMDEGIYCVYLTDGTAGLDEEKEHATELIFSGLSPLHVSMMTTREYLDQMSE